MLIQEINTEDKFKLLAHMHVGRLACAQGAQPYVVPFSFTYNDNYLYAFATIGQKINWMRLNPLVCIQADEVVSDEEWVSIVVQGRYEELPDTPEGKANRELAFQVLQQRANWWELGYARTTARDEVARSWEPIYFRIKIDQITAYHCVSETVPGGFAAKSKAQQTRSHVMSDMFASLRKKMFSA